MSNDCRQSDIEKRQSRRRTLLCCSTLCLFLFLIFFLLLTEVFHERFISLQRNSNKTISINLIKYRSSLIECGQSIVQHENLYQILEQSKIIMQNLNRTRSLLKKQLIEYSSKEEIRFWFELVLAKCFRARQFSVIEQEKPTMIRRIISILRKEFLYIAAFFIKDI